MPDSNNQHPPYDFGWEFHRAPKREKERRRLEILIVLNVLGMFAELLGGLFTGSLALMSDAGHMFTHVFSLAVSYVAIRATQRPDSAVMSFGYFRTEVLAAFFNGITILGIVILIVIEAIRKLSDHPPVAVSEMLGVAVFGLVINLVGAWILVDVAGKDLNLRSVMLHLLADTGSSVAIIASGIVIATTGWREADALVSLVIAVVIGYWGIGLLRQSTKILLQATPEGVDPDYVCRAIVRLDGIRDIHDLHIWELTSNRYVMTGHILVDDVSISESETIRDAINALVSREFNIGHTTLQFETVPRPPTSGKETAL